MNSCRYWQNWKQAFQSQKKLLKMHSLAKVEHQYMCWWISEMKRSKTSSANVKKPLESVPLQNILFEKTRNVEWHFCISLAKVGHQDRCWWISEMTRLKTSFETVKKLLKSAPLQNIYV